MASPRVLVVDSDRSSLGLLTHGMNRFGLNSSGVADLAEARASLAAERPDVVVSEVGAGPGLEVLEELRRNPATRDVPVVLLAKGAWARRRAHARELGAQELIAKPAYVQDIAVLTWLYAGRDANDAQFEGTFGEPSCAALLRGLLAGGRTGTLQLEPYGATIRFREGAIVDASLPSLTGERALMRILTLGTGNYELSFGPLEVTPTMQFELADLAGRGLSHVHDWQELQAQLEPMDQVLTVDYRALSSQVSDLPSGLWGLLRLFDGKRSIAEVLGDSALDDLTTGHAIAKLKTLDIFERAPANAAPSSHSPAHSPGVDRVQALSTPVPPPPEPRAEYERAVYEEDLPALPSDAELFEQTPAVDLRARAEQSFFDSPASELSREAGRERARRRDGLRAAGWALLGITVFAAVIVLWRGTPGAETPPQVAAAPAQAPAPQVAAQPQAAPTPAPIAQAAPVAPVAAPSAAAEAAPVAPPAAEAAAPAQAAAPVAAQAPAPAEAAPAAAAANPAPVDHAADTLLAEGQKAYDHGKFAQAMKFYDQASAIAPNDPAVSLARGLTFYELGDLNHAGAAMTRVLELDANNARAELLLGAIAQERGQPGMAKQHYKKYLELAPNGEHAAETRKLLTRLGG